VKLQTLLHKLEDGLFAVHDGIVSLSGDRLGYLCIVNGIIGDMLEERKSRLAIPMAFYPEGPRSAGAEGERLTRLPDSERICVLAHGMCTSEKDWGFQDNPSKDYGSLLQADLGYFPIYLRYNTGLHISTNGKRFSDLLETLVRRDPAKIKEIVLLGHSMGGLIFRSACYYGKKAKKTWVKRVKRIFYVGSPHWGTHFEKFGKLTTTVLKHIPTLPTKAIAAFIELRSAGIKDLRHGYLTHEDWQRQGADDLLYVHQNKTPLLKTADHYLICGTISKSLDSRIGRLFGDGMVHPGSGIGRGLLPSSRIPFLPDHIKIFPGIPHYNLMKSMSVYRQIREWCGYWSAKAPVVRQ
jgi:pimeloyl-ACP methyl ester carboxylesterase